MFVLYAVRNREGKWFRAKGRHGYGDSWTDDQTRAKVYGKIGQARARRTYFATHHPEFGVPELIKLQCQPVVVDDSRQFEKAKKKASTKKERRAAAMAKSQLERAQREFERAQAELAAAKGRVQ